MKLNKFIVMFAFVALAFSASSCLKEEKEVFDQPASARMEEYLEHVRTLLSSSQYGWLLEYYPGTKYAATVFELKFTEQRVTACHEKRPAVKATSDYSLKKDGGAVISFTSYNDVLHQYATPSYSQYQAKGGDFEFQIIGVEDNLITLRGKRSQNICYLHRLGEPGEDYLASVSYMDKHLSVAAVGATISGGMVEAFLDSGTRTFSIGHKGATTKEQKNYRYVLTGEGIKFNTPFTFQGVTFDSLVFDADNETLSGSGIVFGKIIPTGWVSYQDYLGKYKLTYGSGRGSFEVELVEDEPESSFLLKGLFKSQPDVTVSVDYSGGRGRLSIVRQVVGAWGSKSMLFAPWDSGEGYYTWKEGIGMIGYVEDASVNSFLVQFMDNGEWNDNDYQCNAWLIVPFDGSEPTEDDTPSSWYFNSGSEQLAGDITLTKIAQ